LRADSTSSKNRELLEHLLVFFTFDALVNEASRLVGDKNDEEQESELVNHVFVHHTVIYRLDAYRSNKDERNIPRILLALAKSHCAVQTACRGDLHGSVIS